MCGSVKSSVVCVTVGGDDPHSVHGPGVIRLNRMFIVVQNTVLPVFTCFTKA